jgi:uncharacterized protein (TIGR03435 family)
MKSFRLILIAAGVLIITVPVLTGVSRTSIGVQSQAGPAGASDSQRILGFEVASIKPNRSSDPPSSLFPLGPGDAYVRNAGLFTATNQPLVAYLRFALKVGQVEIPGLPAWADTERFDIEARVPGNPTKDAMRRMMLSLLADRFALKTHTESQMKPAFDLVVAKPGRMGPQLQFHSEKNGSCSAQFPSEPGRIANVPPTPPTPQSGLQLPEFPCGSIGPVGASDSERYRIGGRAVTLDRIAGYIMNPFTGVDRPVLDKTGLTGTFDFSLEWALPRNAAQPNGRPEDADPTFLQALEEQLGLALKATRAAVSVIVVDHIDRPSAN